MHPPLNFAKSIDYVSTSKGKSHNILLLPSCFRPSTTILHWLPYQPPPFDTEYDLRVGPLTYKKLPVRHLFSCRNFHGVQNRQRVTCVGLREGENVHGDDVELETKTF